MYSSTIIDSFEYILIEPSLNSGIEDCSGLLTSGRIGLPFESHLGSTIFAVVLSDQYILSLSWSIYKSPAFISKGDKYRLEPGPSPTTARTFSSTIVIKFFVWATVFLSLIFWIKGSPALKIKVNATTPIAVYKTTEIQTSPFLFSLFIVSYDNKKKKKARFTRMDLSMFLQLLERSCLLSLDRLLLCQPLILLELTLLPEYL